MKSFERFKSVAVTSENVNDDDVVVTSKIPRRHLLMLAVYNHQVCDMIKIMVIGFANSRFSIYISFVLSS